MPEGGVLFISLSRQSTGEVRFFTTLTRSSGRTDADLLLDAGLVPLFADFPGKVHAASWANKLSPAAAKARILDLAPGYRKIVLLDLNSAVLEYSWTRAQAEALVADLAEKAGAAVALYDVMGVMERSAARLEARTRETRERLEVFIQESLRDPSRVSLKKGQYLGNILRQRTLSQLVQVPQSVDVCRSVPYCWPDPEEGDGFQYFRCHFETVRRDAIDESKAVIGLSKMVGNLIGHQALLEFFAFVSAELRDRMGIARQVVIDPSRSLAGRLSLPGVELEIDERMPRDRFLGHLSNSRFAGFFIPTASVGVTAIQNAIPFLSFHAPVDSASYVRHGNPANSLPAFTSLGIWEDIAYIRNLVRRDNPYFSAVSMVDVSSPASFATAEAQLRDGGMGRRIREYLDEEERRRFPAFEEVLFA